MLYSSISYYIVLYYSISYHIILYHIILYYNYIITIISYHIMFYHIILYYIIYTYITIYEYNNTNGSHVFPRRCFVSANISGPATGRGDSAAICSWCYCCCLVQLLLEEHWGNSFRTNILYHITSYNMI